VSAGGRSLGVLHVVGVGIDVEMVECFATALGSMMTLVGTWARLEELHRVLDRLASGVSGFTEGAVEIAEPGAPSAAVPLGVRALDPPVHDRLTARQREVLTLMLSGLSNAEIAERLVVAVPTVKSHVRAILRASGAVNRSDAMARLTRTEGQAGRRSYDGAL
jgi:DNA-binding NarL/FixJ family response regulator